MTIHFIAHVAGVLFLLLIMPMSPRRKHLSLAAQARDPIASLTSFQIGHDYIERFHNLSVADQFQLELHPIILEMGELSKLKGLRQKIEKCLNEIAIYTKNELQKIDSV
jgi:hypothetical protein